MSTVVGIDGCPAGWCYVTLTTHKNKITNIQLDIASTFGDLKRKISKTTLIMVDIPIGLPRKKTHPRLCDQHAKKRLGKRHVCVFYTPPRSVVNACINKSYEEACKIAMEQTGKKMSQQTFNILPKIHQADKAMKSTDQSHIFEVHPELCFMALNQDKPVPSSKKKRLGFEIRYAILRNFFSKGQIDSVLHTYPRKSVARDDVLDALVAAYTGFLHIQGKTESIPNDSSWDEKRLRMEMIIPRINAKSSV